MILGPIHTYYLLKSSFISFIAVILCLNAHSQSNFYRLGIGAGYGITQSYTDLPKSRTGSVFNLNADYHFTPRLSAGIEYQNGNIKGKAGENTGDRRIFTNSFASAALVGKLHLNDWVYVGAGAGVIHNTMVEIERVVVDEVATYPGNEVSNDLLIPINAGISYYFPDYSGIPRFGLNLNLQYNITLGEGLDGYDNSFTTFKNDRPDFYTYFSVGLKYNFGGMGISKRSRY